VETWLGYLRGWCLRDEQLEKRGSVNEEKETVEYARTGSLTSDVGR